ncbi:MAG: nuclear transport factor 2 family protein [Chlorobia bacterium]|nr:nuclear transport factor 2 family protein [Fimbriimonadaceae bacterium]
MKIRLVLLGLAVFALAPAIQNPDVVKAAIQKEMTGYAAALKKKDGALVEKIILANFSPEFKDTDMKGTIRNRQQTIDAMKQNIGMLQSVKSIRLDIVSLKLVGGKAMTTEHMVMDATIPPIGAGAKNSSLKVDSTWNGTYVKKGDKWWCVSSKGTKETVLIDGKKIPG